ncbi:MAG: DUF4281 domain-containing protein [Pseudomonadales bacterium]|nr:DUF4281 domain-containing protein [Pseudomonadales bacterium]
MSADLLLTICNYTAMLGWLFLILLPRWQWTLSIISSGIIPFLLGLVYLALLVSQISNLPEGGGFGSIAALQTLFSNPYAMLAGFVHYLAFDLFIGAWEVKDAQDKAIPHWLVVPCLLFTFMVGPVGLVLYLFIRTARTKDLMVYA